MKGSISHLQGRGKIDYNFVDDSLYLYLDRQKLKTKDHDYETSFDLKGFIVDIDKHKHVIGIELLDASQKLNVSKVTLKFIKKGNLKAQVNKNIILVSLSILSVIRNKEQIFTLNSERENTPKLQDSILECAIVPSS